MLSADSFSEIVITLGTGEPFGCIPILQKYQDAIANWLSFQARMIITLKKWRTQFSPPVQIASRPLR
jgi:hypothetical protein